MDTKAHWTKSGWHGWVYGWKLHLTCVVAAVWIPLSARLTPANEAAPALIYELPTDARFILGAVFVYQLALLYRFQHDLDLNIGLKAFIKAA